MKRFLCAISVSLFLASASAESANMRTVVVTDQQAPMFPIGVVFDQLGRPHLNNDGYVVFAAKFFGTGVTTNNDDVLWTDRSGELAFIARAGAQAFGLPMFVTYKTFGTPILNDAGNLAFEASLKGTGVTFENDEIIYSEGANGIFGMIAREGTQAPGTFAGITHNGIYPPRYNNDGRVLFGGALKGTGVDFTNNAAVWSGFPGNVGLVVREAQVAPGLPSSVQLKYGSTDIGAVLGGSNQCAFRAGLDGGGVTTDNDNIVYSGSVFSPATVVREGTQVPGAPAGVNVGNVLQPTINESGQTAFLSILGGAVDNTNNNAILSNASGSLQMIARKGNPAPNAGTDAVFDFLQLPLLSADGSIAFGATLTGAAVDDSNDEVIYSNNTGTLTPFVREGDRAPGTPADVLFSGDAMAMLPAFTGQTAMNDVGQIVFVGRLEGPAVNDGNRMGVWMHDPLQGTRLIARTGDVIEIAPGDSRILQQIILNSGSGGSDGKPNSLNDNGEFAFWAQFTDGSSAILVTADTDSDGTIDAFDNCPNTVNADQADSDDDGVGDECDNCPDDADKIDPGICGCGETDGDTDGDGVPDCFDDCPNDADKTNPGDCGCGVPEGSCDDGNSGGGTNKSNSNDNNANNDESPTNNNDADDDSGDDANDSNNSNDNGADDDASQDMPEPVMSQCGACGMPMALMMSFWLLVGGAKRRSR